MNDRIKESLSALVDGETDELEVRRLLNQLEQDDAVRDTWQRYQMIGALLRDEPAVNVDLSRGIAQAIAGEPMDEVVRLPQQAVRGGGHRMRWLASGAVAATVTLAVLVGVRVTQDDRETVQMAQTSQQMPASADIAGRSPVQLAEVSAEQVDPQQLEQAQRKLQEYVMQHTEQAAMSGGGSIMPYARVVNFGTSEEKR